MLVPLLLPDGALLQLTRTDKLRQWSRTAVFRGGVTVGLPIAGNQNASYLRTASAQPEIFIERKRTVGSPDVHSV